MKRRMFTLEQILEAEENMEGLCLNCGAVRECCEPDAHEYLCEECGQDKVYGPQELVLMGRVE